VPTKPAGYSTVSPYLIVAGAQRVVDFLWGTFEGQELRRLECPDGAIVHTEIRLGDTVVMLADAAAQGGRSRPARRDQGPRRQQLVDRDPSRVTVVSRCRPV
jgi:uncharacterized glyoxalase superfamily protein PhnB